MMRSIQILFLLLAVVCCRSIAAGPMLKATFSSTTMYYGIGPNSDKSIVAEVTIATPEGVYYGSWNLSGHRKGETLTADSWSGPEPAPKVVLKDFDNTVSRSACKNLPSNWRGCGSLPWRLRYKAMIMVAPGWRRAISLLPLLSLTKRIPRRIRAVQFARKFPLILLISPGMRTFRNRKQPSCLMPPVAR